MSVNDLRGASRNVARLDQDAIARAKRLDAKLAACATLEEQ